jgi:hypothetical protein
MRLSSLVFKLRVDILVLLERRKLLDGFANNVNGLAELGFANDQRRGETNNVAVGWLGLFMVSMTF